MNKWLSYIILALGCFGLASCQNDDTPAQPQSDGQVSVHLQISLPGGDSAGRGADARGFEDDGTDDTTKGQKTIVAEDVYVLVFHNDALQGVVPITSVTDADGDSNTKILEGTFDATGLFGESLQLVVLANLSQNGVSTTFTEGTLQDALYNSLIYIYDGSTTPWNTDEDSQDYRRIPMWGATGTFTLSANQLNQSCDLHRAVAKLGFRIDDGKGYGAEKFKITGITIDGAMNQGKCKSSATLNGNYYNAPDVPTNAGTQTIQYTGLNVTTSYENQIYLPEQDISENALTITVAYVHNGVEKTKDITFEEDVIRNHSYIYNITVKEEFDVTIAYEVVEWDSETINIPTFN